MVVERSRAFVSCSAAGGLRSAASNGYIVRISLCVIYVYIRIFLLQILGEWQES